AASAVMLASAASASGGGSTTPANTTLIGAGSATTYNMMQAFDTLYSDSPGCDLIDNTPTPQALDFSCPDASNTNTPPNVSSDYPPYPDFATSPGYTDNPANDVAMSEPPLGSGNGIQALEGQSGTSSCSSSQATAPLSYARSSSAPGGSN